MSHSQFHSIEAFILRHAWLNLWDERMTTGRINQIAIVSIDALRGRSEKKPVKQDLSRRTASIKLWYGEAEAYAAWSYLNQMIVMSNWILRLTAAEWTKLCDQSLAFQRHLRRLLGLSLIQ